MSESQEAVPPDVAAPPSCTGSTSSDNASVITSTSTTSVRAQESVRPSSLPKPSGLKPPSKIGRLCSNAAPKPAVPISPRSDGGSSDTIRKLSDDLSRKHLSDLLEAEEDEVSSTLPERSRIQRKASTGSTFSMTSMDSLWEKHPRRLSEAGLRRSSDHSVVLTEDTDSFIIGERVWVGGTKPGQIAYIGETQFAPGDWAGIVLDEPIGKNDGSVAGVRYFQCSEKKGVFSRLTRLTRISLIPHGVHDSSPTSDAGSVFERPPSGLARQRRALSPNGSIRSVVSSKMNASISTTTGGELRLGDRVIVSSSRGSKAGLLRYVGVTDFAPGVWGGVELDDPLGKNDGSVDGKRYFECSPRFGLFAPISKVSRSPSNRKPGNCVIHNNGRATPLRRSNSRESLTSLGTSIASSRIAGLRLGPQRVGAPRATSTPVSAKNALQELLREKQHHVERLMRERELERTETAKITLQAERAENTLAIVKKQATEVTEENEKLKTHLDKLNKLLEDERQKVEDLMFRNEEENINKEDYNKYRETMEKEKAVHEQRIRDLEAEAALQLQRADATAAALRALEEQRNLDLASLAEQHREELAAAQTLSSELQKLLDEAYALLREKENEKDSLGKSMSEELSKLKMESDKALNEAKTKLAIAQTEFETQQSVLTAKLQLVESKLEAEKQSLERLNKDNSQVIVDLTSKLTQLQASLDDKTLELNKITGTSKEHEVNLNKEITKLKMELSAKVLDLEQIEDSKKKQDVACKNIQEELSKLKEEYSSKINEYESLLNEASQQNEKSKTEIFELQKSLSAKEKDYEKLLNDSSSANSSTEQLINEYKEKINERDKEVIKLKDEFEQVTASFNIKHSKIAEEHKKEIDERNTKIEELTKEIQIHRDQLDKSKVDLEALNTQYIVSIEELKSLKEENERLHKSINDLTQTNNTLKENISSMELEIGELTRQRDSISEKCNELQNAKDKMESEYMNLTGQATDSNEQFMKLSQHLKDTEKELQELREKHRETTNNHGRIEQELKQKMFKSNEDFALERTQLTQSINDNVEKLKETEEKIVQYEQRVNDVLKRISEMTENNDKLLDENTILKQEIQTLKTKEHETITEFEVIRKKLEVDIDRYKEEISLLKADGATSEVKLMEKVDQLTEAQNDLNNKLEEARKHEDSLQKVINDMTAQLNHQKTDYEGQITQIKNQMSAISGESATQQAETTRLQGLLDEKQNVVKELTLKLEMLEVDLKSNLEIVTEKDRQIAEASEEYNKISVGKKELEQKLNEVLLENTNLKQKHENLVASSAAEESLMKDQEGKLDGLRKQITILTQEKTVLEDSCKVTTIELGKMKEQYGELENKLKETTANNEELMKSLEELKNTLQSQSDKNNTDSNKIKSLEDDISKLKQEVANKENSVMERETELKNLKDSLQVGTTETQEIIRKLQEENKQINEKHKSETDSLNSTLKSLQNEILEKNHLIEDLQKSKVKITELQEQLVKSELDIKQLNSINEGQKSNYEDLNKQLQLQYEEFKKESKRAKHELKVKLIDFEKALEESQKQNTVEVEKQTQLQNKLTETENKVVELANKLELAAVQQNATEAKDDKLEKLTLELQAARKSTADAIANSEKQIHGLKSDMEHKAKELKHKSELLTKLQDELRNFKTKLEVAEREKVMLQKDLVAKSKDKNDNNAMGILGQGDVATASPDTEVEGQVSFLNSVIVDMQRKNEQLMARVQALECGQTEPIPNGHKPKLVAPRLFCDICDVFDAHDTDDCPKQAQVDEDAPAQVASKPRAPPRPYCDICEVFGHSTENCDEEETF